MTDTTATTTTTVSPLVLLRDSLVANREGEKRGFVALLSCTQKENSPVHHLLGQTDALRMIQSFSVGAKVPLYNNNFEYDVVKKIDDASGHLLAVEALLDQGGRMEDGSCLIHREWCGSLKSPCFFTWYLQYKAVRLSFVRAVAWETNSDGSWLSEAQLRQRLRCFLYEQYGCWETSFGFNNSSCFALPGDTIWWRWKNKFRVATRWVPASDAELQARRWCANTGLYLYCHMHREGLGEVPDFEDSDEEDCGRDIWWEHDVELESMMMSMWYSRKTVG
jgi:hypothetical protein